MIFKDVGCLVSSRWKVAVGSVAYSAALTLDFVHGSVAPLLGLMGVHVLLGLFAVARKDRCFSFVMANISAEMFTLMFFAFALFGLMMMALGDPNRIIHPPDAMRDMQAIQTFMFCLWAIPTLLIAYVSYDLVASGFPNEPNLIE
jgi:hypothetical protein